MSICLFLYLPTRSKRPRTTSEKKLKFCYLLNNFQMFFFKDENLEL